VAVLVRSSSQLTVVSAGQVTAGASSSMTVTIWSQLEALPQSSVAVQVRVITSSCAQLPSATLSLSVIANSLSQLSVALTLPVAVELLSSSQLTVVSAGQVIAGASSSTTVMTWSQSLLLPQSSVAVQVRVITFSCAQLPAATLSLKLKAMSLSQLSLAVALPVTPEPVDAAIAVMSTRQLAAVIPGVQLTVESAGQLIAGASSSMTVTTWSQLEMLPQASVAVQVRVITSACAQLPASTLSLSVMLNSLSQLSVALATPVPALVRSSSQFTVTSAGQLIAGAASSTTVTTWSQLEALPQASVPVQVRVMTLSCAQLPLATLSLSVMLTSLSQLSVALALPVLALLLSSSQLTVVSAGQLIAGASSSTTVTT
jgi:hypothetical protein